jgi:transcriptional regulator with XRE-family HTH domain
MSPAELKTWREAVGLSSTNLADLIGVETRAVNRWEAGTNTMPPGVSEGLQALRKSIGATMDTLRHQLLAERPAVLYRFREPIDMKHHARALWDAGLSVQGHAAVLWAVHLETGAPIEWHP